MADMKKVFDFLDEAGVFFLATVDGDQPKCRPLGFHMMDGNTLYFGVGTHKNVYRQLRENNKCEICACIKDRFLRLYGRAEFDERPDLAQKALEAMPQLKEIYNETTGHKMGIFHLEKGAAEFYNAMGQVEDRFEF